MKEKSVRLVKFLFIFAMVFGLMSAIKTKALAASYITVPGYGEVSVSMNRETWSYDADTRTLTLNNFTYDSNNNGFKFVGDGEGITFNLVLQGTNSIVSTGSYGFYVKSRYSGRSANLIISGPGTLNVTSNVYDSIYCSGDRTIKKRAVVNIISEGYQYRHNGVEAEAIFITDSEVTAIAIPKVTSTITSSGLHANSRTGIQIICSKVKALGTYSGIMVDQNINFGKNSEVYLNGGECGLRTSMYGTVTIDSGVKSVEVIGGKVAFSGPCYVTNALAGTGWIKQSEESEETVQIGIPIKKLGQIDDCYKVLFQYKVPTITTEPTATNPTYTGSELELVTEGSATDGTMQYAIGTDGLTAPDEASFDTVIPQKTEVGTYYVWYRAAGACADAVTEAKCITAMIKRVDETPSTGGDDHNNPSGGNDPDNPSGGDAPAKPSGGNSPANSTGGDASVNPISSVDSQTQVTENINNKQKSTSLSKLQAGNKKATISWKKVTAKGIKGYEIQYSTDKSFNSETTKKVTIKKTKTTKTTIKKLKPKTKYYVRIRTFSKKNGENVYSKWSKVKSVKVK